jgi:hypothetical protein
MAQQGTRVLTRLQWRLLTQLAVYLGRLQLQETTFITRD